jgi:uncharacterized membrane protein YtjA (UPF0391 family)
MQYVARFAALVINATSSLVPERSGHIFLIMLRAAITLMIIALIAALFGFTGIAAGAASIAKILFFVFLVLAVCAALGGMLFGKRLFGSAW